MDGININKKLIKLKSAISKSIELAIVSAARKGINLDIKIDEDLKIVADVDMLNLTIRNLLNNALKFTHKNGIIRISAQKLDTEIYIVIKDTSLGIAHNQQKQLFTFKAKSSFGTLNEKGTGLGLILCKNYTELQGGKIWFESTENIGTKFFLAFPTPINKKS